MHTNTTLLPAQPAAPAQTARSRSGLRQWALALPFLAPTLIGLAVFIVYPLAASLYYSFTRWNLLTPPVWIGAQNYLSLLKTPLFWKVLGNTLQYLALYLPPAILVPLLLAVLLNQKLGLTTFYRTVFFLPVVTSTVAIAMVWVWLYNPEFGPLNSFLRDLGIQAPRWLADPDWAMPAVVIMSVWKMAGYNMVIYLAGLQGIPGEYYEAAAIDGAARWRQFWHITLPLISPTTFFVLITSIIGSFQVFEATYILTKGGPINETLTLALYIYQVGFQYSRMGLASALAWVLFALTMALTLVQYVLQRRWVFYG